MMKALSLQGQKLIVAMALVSLSAVALIVQAAPVDDSRFMQLEQEVRSLQRQLEAQTRRIDALESALRQSRGRAALPEVPLATTSKTPKTTPAWLQSSNWAKLRAGMPDSEVLRMLGPATTSRRSEQGDTQTLFYALELDAGGFLSGTVVVADHRILEIHKPALK
jgi:hypothetical protein